MQEKIYQMRFLKYHGLILLFEQVRNLPTCQGMTEVHYQLGATETVVATVIRGYSQTYYHQQILTNAHRSDKLSKAIKHINYINNTAVRRYTSIPVLQCWTQKNLHPLRPKVSPQYRSWVFWTACGTVCIQLPGILSQSEWISFQWCQRRYMNSSNLDAWKTNESIPYSGFLHEIKLQDGIEWKSPRAILNKFTFFCDSSIAGS